MPLTVLVTGDPAAPYLSLLDQLPAETRVIASNDRQRLRDAAPEADIILNSEFRDPSLLLDTFPHATRVQWLHLLSAGVESVLSPKIVASPVPMTNGRGVFRTPLAEWVLASMLHFSYGLRRLQQQQEAGVWEPFDVDELNGKTLGIVGYVEIGRGEACRARPVGVVCVSARRNQERSARER